MLLVALTENSGRLGFEVGSANYGVVILKYLRCNFAKRVHAIIVHIEIKSSAMQLIGGTLASGVPAGRCGMYVHAT